MNNAQKNAKNLAMRITEPVCNTRWHLTIDNWFADIDMVFWMTSRALYIVSIMKRSIPKIPDKFQQRNIKIFLLTLLDIVKKEF